jgi:FlaA1/EpsC-like NDP-sugar epimerase
LVMISTDKAVSPSSVMGASKRIAEWLVLDAQAAKKQIFSVVRFGNVLGSRGSVVPLFKKQIQMGGPITVTHLDMERYFMTIPEAVHLVLQALTFDISGQTYMLNMGEAVNISELAKDLIRLSGLEPGEDIEIVYGKSRPGEKLSEELWEAGMEYQPTQHPEISSVLEAKRLSGEKLTAAINKLGKLAEEGKRDEILKEMTAMLPNSELGKSDPNQLQSLV